MGLLDKPFAPTDYLKVAQYLRDRRNISLRVNDDDLDPLLRAAHARHRPAVDCRSADRVAR